MNFNNDINSLSNDEKFHYLISSHVGQLLTIIQHYELSGNNYQSAYDALFHWYKNKR